MMKHYCIRYDFVNVISNTVSKLMGLINPRSRSVLFPTKPNPMDTSPSPLGASGPTTWGDIVLRQPQLYSRLSISLDYSLSRGRYPRDDELPSWTSVSSSPAISSEPIALEYMANGGASAPMQAPSTVMSCLCNDLAYTLPPRLSDASFQLSPTAISDVNYNDPISLRYDIYGHGSSIGTNFNCDMFDDDLEPEEYDAGKLLFGISSFTSSEPSVKLT